MKHIAINFDAELWRPERSDGDRSNFLSCLMFDVLIFFIFLILKLKTSFEKYEKLNLVAKIWQSRAGHFSPGKFNHSSLPSRVQQPIIDRNFSSLLSFAKHNLLWTFTCSVHIYWLFFLPFFKLSNERITTTSKKRFFFQWAIAKNKSIRKWRKRKPQTISFLLFPHNRDVCCWCCCCWSFVFYLPQTDKII